MNQDFFAHRRTVPPHTPEPQPHAADDTAKNNDLQQLEAASNSVQEHVLPDAADFTISVDQVREHLRGKGLTKSKDTIQRWCRTGELTCQKQGLLGRYFTTESSLSKLEQKLLPDMMAENSGAKKVAEPAVQQHAGADETVRPGAQVNEGADAGASNSTQPDVQVHAAERSSDAVVTPGADVASLAAEVSGLQAQLENRDKQIEFLQEEIRSGREQRGAVVQISNRMLETLETMAIGGRLERPRQQGSTQEQSPDTVHVVPTENARDAV